MFTNFIFATERAEVSLVDHLPSEPFVMVPHSTVDFYVDYTDATVMGNLWELGFGMEPQVCPRIGEYIYLRY